MGREVAAELWWTCPRSKDPDSTLDYAFDWTDWLGGDTITAATVNPDVASGATVVGTPTWTGGKAVTCWLTGGTLGTTARVVCHISTAAGRTEDQTLVAGDPATLTTLHKRKGPRLDAHRVESGAFVAFEHELALASAQRMPRP